MMLLHRKLFYFIPFHTTNKTRVNPPSQNYLLRCLLQFSTSLSQNPSPQTHFMVDYLINSCGFSLDRATKLSKHFTRLESTQKPELALQFLKQQGFNDTQITSLISRNPKLLCAEVEKTLEPNIKALRGIGFSGSELTQLILSSPHSLIVPGVVSRIKFWRSLLRNDDTVLVKVFKKNHGLIRHDTSKNITPKFSLLQKLGFSNDEIMRCLLRAQCFITRSLDSIEVLVKRTEELGFPRESKMFIPGLFSVGTISEAKFQSNRELLKSYGWSPQEFLSAFLKTPGFMLLSIKNIRSKMDFLVEKAACKPSYIAVRSFLLTLSLEKRLVPRHYILHILKTKKLVTKEIDFGCFMTVPEKLFVDKYVLSYKEECPELHQSYVAACAGRVPNPI